MKISTILFFCLLMTACMQTKSFHRTNGWYYVTSQTTDSLSQTPFLTVMDFDSLRLETDAFGHSVITGVFLQDKLPIWREATTKSVGKYIAFVFNDTVITAPQVNSPIESGCSKFPIRMDMIWNVSLGNYKKKLIYQGLEIKC